MNARRSAATISPDCAVEETPLATRHVYSGIEVAAEYQANGGTGGSVGLAPTVGTASLPTSGVPTGSPPATLPGGWDLAREFLWGERFPEPLAMIDFTDAGSRPRPGVTTGGVTGGAETLYYHHDALGSVVALTDAGDPEATPDPIPGKIVERYTYDPYGKTVIESWNGSAFAVENVSQFGNPFCWTGQRYDAGVGLYHFLFRSYSPEFGRWLQRDPAGYVDGPNLLEYARSMPIQWDDPFGLSAKGKNIKPHGWLTSYTGVIFYLRDGTRIEFHPRNLEELTLLINVFRSELVTVYIYGHGSWGIQLVGNDGDDVEDEPITETNARDVLGELPGIHLWLMGCQVAAKEAGSKFLQDVADSTGATVSGCTGDTKTLGPGSSARCSFNTGFTVTRRPQHREPQQEATPELPADPRPVPELPTPPADGLPQP